MSKETALILKIMLGYGYIIFFVIFLASYCYRYQEKMQRREAAILLSRKRLWNRLCSIILGKAGTPFALLLGVVMLVRRECKKTMGLVTVTGSMDAFSAIITFVVGVLFAVLGLLIILLLHSEDINRFTLKKLTIIVLMMGYFVALYNFQGMMTATWIEGGSLGVKGDLMVIICLAIIDGILYVMGKRAYLKKDFR